MASTPAPKPSILAKLMTPKSLRLLSWVGLAILALIVFCQNWQSVETPILFMTVSMPRSIFILLMLGTGFLLGLLTPTPWRHKKPQ